MKTRTRLSMLSLVFIVGCETAPSQPSTDATNGALIAGTTYNGSGDNNTQSPIKHVIVIIGENRTFDHVFATYQPVAGQKVDNLLSKGIINADGTPGPNYGLATQFSAIDTNPPTTTPPLANPQPAGWSNSPGGKTPYSVLPPPGIGGPSTPFVSSVTLAGQLE